MIIESYEEAKQPHYDEEGGKKRRELVFAEKKPEGNEMERGVAGLEQLKESMWGKFQVMEQKLQVWKETWYSSFAEEIKGQVESVITDLDGVKKALNALGERINLLKEKYGSTTPKSEMITPKNVQTEVESVTESGSGDGSVEALQLEEGIRQLQSLEKEMQIGFQEMEKKLHSWKQIWLKEDFYEELKQEVDNVGQAIDKVEFALDDLHQKIDVYLAKKLEETIKKTPNE